MESTTPIAQALADATVTFVLFGTAFMLLFGGLPAAWLASVRGREPFLWLFIGLLLGPLAVLLVGLAPIGTIGHYGRCLQCFQSVRRGANRCPWCGSDGAGRSR